jgi:hypothetical protein
VQTGPDGTFTLNNVPAGQNIPLVIQLGRWRRQITIPSVPACQSTALTTAQTHLPTRSTASITNGACTTNAADPSDQGDIPLMAMATGSVDGLECVLRKIGINDCEFTSPPTLANGGTFSKPGRVQFFIERGPGNAQYAGGTPAPGANSPTGNAPDWSDPAAGLVNSLTRMKTYDMTLFACEGGADLNVVPHTDAGAQDGTSAWQQNLVDYTAAGGRTYLTHYGYTWLTNIQKGTAPPNNGPTPFSTTGVWNIDQNNYSPQLGIIDTTYPDAAPFPRGLAFAQWLGLPAVNALAQTNPPGITINPSRHDMNGVNNPPAQEWIHVDPNAQNYPNAPQHMTFNTPLVPPDGGAILQCGRVLYSDFHVHDLGTSPSTNFPAECNGGGTQRCTTAPNSGACPSGTLINTCQGCGSPGDPCDSCTGGSHACCQPSNQSSLTPQEKVLEFMLFDLAMCITQDNPVPAPPCTKKSCSDLGVNCGLSGDGCGGTQQCPPCQAGQTCGGGGVPNQCGAPGSGTVNCTPKACGAGQCGYMGDGCSSFINCGPCTQPGQVCGGGGTNQCGTGTPGSCPPQTCQSQGAQCGPLGDGCGNLLDCGACPSGQVCVSNKCVASGCTKRTCKQANANCGPVADGCGGLLDCGPCVLPLTCGGGGIASQCGQPVH